MRKSPDKVFKLLKLDKIDKLDKLNTEETKLFENPRFKKWVNFVDAKFSKDPNAKVEAIFATLVAHYGDGPALARLLVDGKKTKSFADLAADLQVAQLEKWNNHEKTVEDVLEILELDKTQGNPLLDPLFLQLFAYVKLKHPNDPTAVTEAMLTAFREFYTDDAAWAKFLVDGTRHLSVYNIAYDLLHLELSLWEEGEKTLFTHLGLDQIKEGLFQNPLFMSWVIIVGDFHRGTFESPNDLILSTLIALYGENAAWADILVAGRKNRDTSNFASELMKRQIKRWRQIDEKNVDEVFLLLKLDKIENGLFESPRMLLWLEFVAKDFRKAKKAMYSRAHYARLISHYYDSDYENAKKVAKKTNAAAARKTKKAADAVAEEAKKAAVEAAEEAKKAALEAAEEANAAASEAKKAADAAARKAEEVENSVKKADMAPYEAMLSTLRRHFKNDIALRNSLAKGMEVDDWKMRQTARELQEMLDSSRPQEDRSKVSAPGAELDSNFDVHG
ncbi:hypothetical protein KXD40_007156 [Peronospora effusa]|nr:hypothetical protein KXD40_007156 [Peronospora effusa]